MVECYSYVRFSHAGRQRDGDSVRRQIALSRDLAERRGWAMAKLSYEDKGCSAFRSRNANVGKLGEFLAAIESGAVKPGSVLIVESLDRLSRDRIGVALQLWLRILASGVSIATVTPERVYGPDAANEIQSLLEAIISMQRSHEESALKSSRVKQSWEARLVRWKQTRRPLSATCPGWLEPAVDGFRFIPQHEATLRQIIAWALEGLGLMRTRHRLEADPRRYPCFNRSGRWSEEYLRGVLRSPTLYGALPRSNGQHVEGYYPNICGLSEWLDLQASISGRTKHGGRPGLAETSLLTHLVRHAATGACMRVRCIKVQRGTFRSLVVSTVGQSASIAKGTATPYKAVEDAVKGLLEELTAADLHGDQEHGEKAADLAGATRDLSRARQRVAEIQKRMADLTQNPGIVEALLPSLQLAVDAVRAAEAVMGEAQASVRSARSNPLDAAQSAVAAEREATPEERPALRLALKSRIRDLVESVWLYMAPAAPYQQAVHIQVFFRAGGKRYIVIPPRRPRDGVIIPNLQDVDFRHGYQDPSSQATSKGSANRPSSSSAKTRQRL